MNTWVRTYFAIVRGAIPLMGQYAEKLIAIIKEMANIIGQFSKFLVKHEGNMRFFVVSDT